MDEASRRFAAYHFPIDSQRTLKQKNNTSDIDRLFAARHTFARL
ncbi:hypothetical protein C7534_107122 [Pseudomonas sp. OV226]|jgi:hypothetical protein|nr:hypothetical protein C7534_107122 [Pseudomonas sp. OV226]